MGLCVKCDVDIILHPMCSVSALNKYNKFIPSILSAVGSKTTTILRFIYSVVAVSRVCALDVI
jgi:hypothetical protein